jgi:hypothetical protein
MTLLKVEAGDKVRAYLHDEDTDYSERVVVEAVSVYTKSCDVYWPYKNTNWNISLDTNLPLASCYHLGKVFGKVK